MRTGQGFGSAAVMGFDAGQYVKVFDAYMQDPEGAMKNFQSFEAFLFSILGRGQIRYWPSGWCKGFKQHCLSKWFRFGQTPFPYASKVLVFEGAPQPHQAIQGVWPWGRVEL